MKIRSHLITALVVLNFASGLVSQLSAQTVGNPGFETPSLSVQFQYDPPSGVGQPWTFSNQAGIAISSSSSFEASGSTDGQFGFLQLNTNPGANPAGAGSIAQTISFTSTGPFTLSYLEAGRVANGSGAFGDLTYSVTIAPAGGGGAILSAVDSTFSGQPFTSTVYPFTVPTTGNYVLTFTALSNLSGHTDDTAFIDNISIPEPSAVSLLLLAAATGFVTRAAIRRRQKLSRPKVALRIGSF